jgi:hypothetical protein
VEVLEVAVSEAHPALVEGGWVEVLEVEDFAAGAAVVEEADAVSSKSKIESTGGGL